LIKICGCNAKDKFWRMGRDGRTGGAIGIEAEERLGTAGETGMLGRTRDEFAEAIVGKLIKTPIGTKTDSITIEFAIDGLNINGLSVD